MPSKNSKQTTQKTETATPVAAPVATQAAAPVATPVATQVAAPVTQKGGKKAVATKTETVAAPVAAAPATTPVVAQKGGKKAAAPKTEAVVATTTPAVTQKGGKKAAAPKTEAVAATAVAQKGGKKTAAPKKAATETTEVKEDAEEADVDGRRIRSFKVKLPNKEDFEGRFTGLTPYQAANKALSKYFRETESPQVEVTFSICESTRKSKKSVYTYVGKRLKLETPVTYQIQDGRQIVKNFKNSLKKVKKSETAEASA
jgi:hypothetical protein